MLQENFFLEKRARRTRHQPLLSPCGYSEGSGAEQGEASPPLGRGKKTQTNPKQTDPCRSCEQRHFLDNYLCDFLQDKELSLQELGVYGAAALPGAGKGLAGHRAAPSPWSHPWGHSGRGLGSLQAPGLAQHPAPPKVLQVETEHRAHPSLPAPSGHSGRDQGQLLLHPLPPPILEPNPGQAAPEPRTQGLGALT